MAYMFQNVETGEIFYCDDEVWINAFEAAKADGWKPDGTQYDLYFDMDEVLDDIEDENLRFFTLIIGMRNVFAWDGNYIEKRNQIVTYGDGYYMVMSLRDAGVDPALCDFVAKGAFRICSN